MNKTCNFIEVHVLVDLQIHQIIRSKIMEIATIEHRETQNDEKQRRLFHSSLEKLPFVFAVITIYLDLGFSINSVEQPIKCNFVGS